MRSLLPNADVIIFDEQMKRNNAKRHAPRDCVVQGPIMLPAPMLRPHILHRV